MNDTISYHEVKVIQGWRTREKHLGLGPCGMPPPAGPLHQDFHVKELLLCLNHYYFGILKITNS